MNIGVLTAFVIVCVSVLVLRRTRPDALRSFRTPWMPVVPLVGIGFSIWLISSLEPTTWWRFGIWMAIGLLIYIAYSRRHSNLTAATGPSGPVDSA